MSVIGIDFGNEACYVAVARAGGIECILNEFSNRATPTYVGFGEKSRSMGTPAKNQATTNMKNTAFGFKKLLGRKYKDPKVETEISRLPFNVVETKDGGVGVQVMYLGENRIFSVEEVTAMMLTKLKEIAEATIKMKVNDCVISVPAYFTDGERRALLDAATIAGLNVLKLMNETTATALNYGIYKQDLPNPEEKPRNVVFVDLGQSSLQVSACSFNKGKLKMLSCATEPYIGGRDFDRLMARKFSEDFKTQYKIDVSSNKRAGIRLLTEVEKLKKQMSANATDLPLNIECFMDDKDVHGKMNRAAFEQMTEGLFQDVESCMRKCLQDSKLKQDDIYAVEIVGGSTRSPALKQKILTVFGKPASTTLNQDEAVARGCALQCAMLSPAFKVREFQVMDIQQYPVKLTWNAMQEDGEMEVFAQFHQVPFSKMLSFYRNQPFKLTAQYSERTPFPDPYIGDFVIKNVSPTPEGESQKVKVKIRVNLHGLLTINQAQIFEKKEANEDEPMEEQPKENGEVDSETTKDKESPSTMEVDEAAGQKPESPEKKDGKDGKGKKKNVLKAIDLPIESSVRALSRTQVDALTEQEGKMIAQDKLEKERVDAKNSVEEYVYDIRDKISDSLSEFISENDRATFTQILDDTENWLYEEGDDCQKNVYVSKLEELKKYGEPVKRRSQEFLMRGSVLEELAIFIQLSSKIIVMFRDGHEKYDHLDPAEVEKAHGWLSDKFQWMEKSRSQLNSTPKHVDPPVLTSQIAAEKQSLESQVNPILQKAKPKVEPPPEPPKEEAKPDGGAKQQPESKSNDETTKKPDSMEVD